MHQLTNSFKQLTYRIIPNLADRTSSLQNSAILIMTYLYFLLPFLIIGTVWLWLVTDWSLFVESWAIMLFLLVLLGLLDQRPFVLPISLSDRLTIPFSTSLSNLLSLTMLLIFGPTSLWILWVNGLFSALADFQRRSRYPDSLPRIFILNDFVQSNGSNVFFLLLAAAVYSGSGGQYPFNPSGFVEWLPAIWAILALTFAPLIVYFLPTWSIIIQSGLSFNRQTFLQFFGGVTIMSLLALPFALPVALVYDAQNLTLFIFFCLSVAVANMLAYFLSQFSLLTQVRAKELRTIEAISEQLIAAPADGSTLEAILREYLPQLFPDDHLALQLFPAPPDEPAYAWSLFALKAPTNYPPVPESSWERIQQANTPMLVDRKVVRPGDKAPFGDRFLLKIVVSDRDEAVGGIYLQRRPSRRVPNQVLPTLQELASQIGSALYRAQTYQETLQQQKMVQELAFAGRIQQSFLPNKIPQRHGWDFAAALIPAKQTSGDFYDFVPLGNGRIGLVVADVADKGTGAALYMALSRTLIRTYALQYPDAPGKALQLANERILSDTESDQFVTVFYGVLDLANGRLTYANAGHNPTYLIGSKIQTLTKTGIPLGMFEEMVWGEETVQLDEGDSLILYSDGIPEAQNNQQEEFGEERLLAAAQQESYSGAAERQNAITQAVAHFVGSMRPNLMTSP